MIGSRIKYSTIRIAILLGALAFGALLVFLLTFTGNRSKGPLEDLFSGLGDQINTIENNMAIKVRKQLRSDKLKWFEPYRNNVALLRNPDTMLWGAFDNTMDQSFRKLLDLEDSVAIPFPLMHFYSAWGSKTNEAFPRKMVRAIYNLGSIPFITWEPWLSDFSSDDISGIPAIDQRDIHGLDSIANGMYDSYIDEWAAKAKKMDIPVFIRFGHEMNDPYRYPWGPQNNDPENYIAAWRHVVGRFRLIGADKVIWVWSPHPAYGQFSIYYPGDDYVDWIGIPVLNYGNVASWSQWSSFASIFGKYYEELASFHKPIILSEFASLAVGGERSQWFSAALDSLPDIYPDVKGIMFFHSSDDQTTTYKSLNWQIFNDSASIQAIKNGQKSWHSAGHKP